MGSLEENTSNSGIAHYLEHVMFLGTYRYSQSDFVDIMKQASASYNAFTSYDITGYYITVPNTYIKEAIIIESDRMRGLIFDPLAVENEKQVIKQEKNMRQNSSYSNFFEVLRQYQYPITNYGRNVIGYDSSFFDISVQDLKSFYKMWYQPQNARLFIIGSMDVTKVTRLVKKHYGKISACRLCDFKRPDYIEQPYQANINFEYQDKSIDKDLILLSYLAPSFGSLKEDKKKIYALYILARLLNSNSGELSKDLILKKKIAIDFWVDYNPVQKGNSVFSIGILPNKNIKDYDVAFKEIKSSIDKIITKGFSEQLLQAEFTKIKNENEYLKEDSYDYILTLARSLNIGLSYDDVVNFADNIKEVTVNDVKQVAEELFAQKNIKAIAKG